MRVVALDVERRPQVIGSTSVPTGQTAPIAVHTSAGRSESGWDLSAAIMVATGIGQRALVPQAIQTARCGLTFAGGH